MLDLCAVPIFIVHTYIISIFKNIYILIVKEEKRVVIFGCRRWSQVAFQFGVVSKLAPGKERRNGGFCSHTAPKDVVDHIYTKKEKIMRSFLVQLVVVVLRTLTLPSYVTGFRSATWLLPPPPQQANHHRHSWWYPSCSPPQHVTTTPLRLYRVHRTKGLVVICQNNNNNNNVGTNELSDKEPEVVIQIEDLALSQIAELIEVSFIQACMVRMYVHDVYCRRSYTHIYIYYNHHNCRKKVTLLTHHQSSSSSSSSHTHGYNFFGGRRTKQM